MLGESSRSPASGNRYVVNAGGADCALADESMRRLTSAIPDRPSPARGFWTAATPNPEKYKPR
jgi:hypothetical protein